MVSPQSSIYYCMLINYRLFHGVRLLTQFSVHLVGLYLGTRLSYHWPAILSKIQLDMQKVLKQRRMI